MKPLLSGRRHLKSTWNSHFYRYQPVLNRHLWSNSTTQHARHQKCERLPRIATHNFFHFYIKNVTWRTYLISFTAVQYCFLFRFVCIELVSLIWFLQIWVAIYVYGTMTNWSTLIKKLMQTYIIIVSRSILNVSTVHLNGIWHLIWRYLSKPVLGLHPEGFTVLASSETQGQIVGKRESLNGRKNMARRKVKNGEKSPWGQCLTRPVPNGRRRSGLWLSRKTQKFSGTNQKAGRRRPFGTGLVRYCPQGLFSSFFTFLRSI